MLQIEAAEKCKKIPVENHFQSDEEVMAAFESGLMQRVLAS